METTTDSSENVSSESSASADVSEVSAETLVGQQALRYETQFFGFTPKSLGDGSYNAAVQFTYDCLMDVAQFIKPQGKGGKDTEQGMTAAAEALFKAIQPAYSKHFDKLEVYVGQNIMKLNPSVLLEEDLIRIDYPDATNADVEKLEAELRAAEEKLVASRHFISFARQELTETEPIVGALKQQIERQQQQLAACHTVLDEFASLQNLASDLSKLKTTI